MMILVIIFNKLIVIAYGDFGFAHSALHGN